MAIITSPINDVAFPDFTSSLIHGVFQTIQDNHLAQIQSYSDLLTETSVTIGKYAENNYLNVPDEAVFNFLNKPFALDDKAATTKYLSINHWLDKSSGTLKELTKESYKKLNEYLTVELSPDIKATSKVDNLMEAVRKKIASENYSSLQEMVKMGMQRIVADDIIIKARLAFNSSTYHFDASKASASTYGKKAFNISGGASYKGKKFGAYLNGGYSSVKTTVNASSSYKQNNDSANLNLLGYVKIKAHTDYQSLSA